ncbi:MAG: hypothetical protein KDA41_20770 [Planctomycetales bacterium]|nr:hypothetical protein [Planctomycetales bacterium]
MNRFLQLAEVDAARSARKCTTGEDHPTDDKRWFLFIIVNEAEKCTLDPAARPRWTIRRVPPTMGDRAAL